MKQVIVVALAMLSLNGAWANAGTEINYKAEGSKAKSFLFYDGKEHSVAVTKARAYINSLINSSALRETVVQPEQLQPGFSFNMIEDRLQSGPGYTIIREIDTVSTYIGEKDGMHVHQDKMTSIQLDKYGERMIGSKMVIVADKYRNSPPRVEPEYSRIESKTFIESSMADATSTTHTDVKLISSRSKLSNEYPVEINVPYESSGDYKTTTITKTKPSSAPGKETRYESKAQQFRVCIATGSSKREVLDNVKGVVRTVCATVNTTTTEVNNIVTTFQFNKLIVNYYSTEYGIPVIHESVDTTGESTMKIISITRNLTK